VLTLAFDTATAVATSALVDGDEILGERVSRAQTLLEDVDALLRQGGAHPRDLGALVVGIGPGSFTGVRIGLATVLGFHQALGLPVATPTTFEALAAAAPEDAEVVIAAVDALRGDWSVQVASSEPELVAGAELPRLASGRPGVVIGFGVSRLAGLAGWPADLRLVEPGPLAAAAARLVAAPETVWDPGLLTHPLYARPAAFTPARPRVAVSIPQEA
jgi:tRNA threonylcarbamoyl adenosine modification protein YeaZ